MLKKLFGSSQGVYHPLNRVEVCASSLVHNYQYLSKKCGMKIFPVLKSNAYGHGIYPVAQILESVHAPFFCVDSLYEAYQLSSASISTPILIMGGVHPESLEVKQMPFSFAIGDTEMAKTIKKYQPYVGVHLFVDTGMHREGVALRALQELVRTCKQLDLRIEGLMSHMAMADKPQDPNTKAQVKNFLLAQKIVSDEGITPRWIHLGASSFILNSKKYASFGGNAARAGIALYGIDPEGKDTALKPTLRLITTITQVKDLNKGDKVGYDFTFSARKKIKAAVLPIGYNDGLNRRLSGKGRVIIDGISCMILGRVSMNITVVDVTEVPQVKVGTEVVVYSSFPSDQNSIFNSAKVCETIPYELLVNLHTSTKRVITSQ